MDTKLTQKLYKKYLKFFKQHKDPMTETAMCWGLECGDGWYSIIEEVCAFLAEAGMSWTFSNYNQETQQDEEPKAKDRVFEFTQIKEKYGTLRMYYTTNSKTLGDMAAIMTTWAEWKSGKTCEGCGGPAKMNKGFWSYVMCKKCKGKEK